MGARTDTAASPSWTLASPGRTGRDGSGPHFPAPAIGELPPLRRWRDYPVLALAAAGLWASFPDQGWWFLLVPSLALFVSALDRVGTLRATWYAAVVAAGFWLPHIEWVRVATGGWMPWVVLSLTQVIAWALWGWTVSVARVWRWTRTVWGQALVVGLTWVGIEQLRSRVPFGGFAWANVSYAQVDAPLGHLAPWGGEVLVSFATLVAAVLLRRAVSLAPAHEGDHWWGRPASLGVALVILVAPLGLSLPTAQESGSLKVGVVQGNVEIPGIETFSEPNKVTGNHVRESDRLAASGQDVDLVIWGENAADLDPRTHPATARLIADAVERVGAPTMLGFVEYQEDSRTNWVGIWYPGESQVDPVLYGKQHPVPFGEYIPWRDFISSLASQTAQVSVDMRAVDNPGYLEVHLEDGRTVPVAVGICFEVAYEPLVSEGVRMGGQLISIPTNNFHFRYSAESTQQAQMLRFRAMEFSRSAVQASTNGVSMIVRPDGSVVAASGKQEAAHLVADLPLRTSLTPAARLAEFPAWCAIVLTLLIGVGSTGALIALRRPVPHAASAGEYRS